ncbi:hypothetical protein LCGC14_1188930 [marine sediment metagenome]|uniref:VRR-NUC domain-containing protein n=1 Tax=marine sediment metagenome TaxID=412755 RepID=A0A0F9LK44_9ZZZZ
MGNNLRDRRAYGDAAWDWSLLNGCFGDSKIRPSDIDGVIERKGHYLYLEAKPSRGHLGQGQRILLEGLCKQPNNIVIVVWGDNENPERMQIMQGGEVYPAQPTDRDGFRKAVADWYKMANAAQAVRRG